VAAVIPDKFEVGTQNHEGIAGTLGAIEYLASLAADGGTRRACLQAAMTAVHAYEQTLSARLLALFARHPEVQVYGITEPARLAERVPTFAINVAGYTPREVAQRLAAAGVNVWHGNYYALEPMTRLGLEAAGGAVRISLVHYNHDSEIEALAAVLADLVG
jgi:selenocysteine lyase/cysteine desulfurase